MLILQRLHLAKPPDMTLFVAWLRPQKGIGEFFRQCGTYDPRADAHDIHAIMLDALMRAVGIMADCRVNATKFAGGNTRANATSA
jgi:hypothetical protein